MTGTIALIAALPGELKPLVAPKTGERWQRVQAAKGMMLWERRTSTMRWIAGCSGMGGAAAAVTLREMERFADTDKPLAAICSVGWVGALDAGVGVASVWHVGEVIDTLTGERFRTAAGTAMVLATAARVADAPEKARLAASYGARLVDMEAATLARIAQARGTPFFCIKAVSDDWQARLPDLNRFVRDGRMRTGRFVAHAAVRPAHWRGLVALGRHSRLGARLLAETVQAWLNEQAEG